MINMTCNFAVKYRVRQRGCSLPHSARTPPARDKNNFLGRGFFGGRGIFWGQEIFGFFLGQGIFFGLGYFFGTEDFFGGGGFLDFYLVVQVICTAHPHPCYSKQFSCLVGPSNLIQTLWVSILSLL